MIAITSARDCKEDPEYRDNQLAALNSWLPIFDKVIYVGKFQEEFKNKKVAFCPSEEFPKIRDLLLIASHPGHDYSVILNADIILAPPFRSVLDLMKQSSIPAGVSRRLNFDRRHGIKSGVYNDLGLDIFVAKPEVWRKSIRDCPKNYRIGHSAWDTFVSGWLNATLKNNVVDFSHYRCVYHPLHNGRKAPHQSEITYTHELLKHASIPGRRL